MPFCVLLGWLMQNEISISRMINFNWLAVKIGIQQRCGIVEKRNFTIRPNSNTWPHHSAIPNRNRKEAFSLNIRLHNITLFRNTNIIHDLNCGCVCVCIHIYILYIDIYIYIYTYIYIYIYIYIFYVIIWRFQVVPKITLYGWIPNIIQIFGTYLTGIIYFLQRTLFIWQLLRSVDVSWLSTCTARLESLTFPSLSPFI